MRTFTKGITYYDLLGGLDRFDDMSPSGSPVERVYSVALVSLDNKNTIPASAQWTIDDLLRVEFDYTDTGNANLGIYKLVVFDDNKVICRVIRRYARIVDNGVQII